MTSKVYLIIFTDVRINGFRTQVLFWFLVIAAVVEFVVLFLILSKEEIKKISQTK